MTDSQTASTQNPNQARLTLAQALAKEAGQLALAFFNNLSALEIENKSGAHDLVSEADLKSELLIRNRIKAVFPEDGILGEELGFEKKNAKFIWVIDPIDGTQMFLSGIPSWCVSVAVVCNGKPVVGVVYDPIVEDCYAASAAQGAFLNGRKLKMDNSHSFTDGMVGVGTNRPGSHRPLISIISYVLQNDGQIVRNGSGALMLAQVAASRLIAYYEERMFPWDCMAGLCLIKEAGGTVCDYPFSNHSIEYGATILVGTNEIFSALKMQNTIHNDVLETETLSVEKRVS